MTPETEVIACPACKHPVRVPLDWLGTEVQCPECQARFRAPARVDGTLTAAELLSRPPSPAGGPKPRPRPDAMLLLPAFGLLVCGAVGVLVNGWMLFIITQSEPADQKKWTGNQVEALRKAGIGGGDPPAEQAQKDADEADALLRLFRWFIPLSLVVSAVVFAGGVSMALRWNYRLAQAGCVLASLNFAHLCCVPGAAAGLWGLLMLGSTEGREHFGR